MSSEIEQTEMKKKGIDRLITEETSKIIIATGFVLVGVALIFFFWFEWTSFKFTSQIKADKFGQLGDFIGGIVGSLWALAGVILFYVALKKQKEDVGINREALYKQIDAIDNQIKEFELTREVHKATQQELEFQKKEFQIQNNTLSIQRFENTFFQLLGIHNQIVDGMDEKVTVHSVLDRDFYSYENAVSALIESQGEQKGLDLLLNDDLDYGSINTERLNITKRDVFEALYFREIEPSFIAFLEGLSSTISSLNNIKEYSDEYGRIYQKVQTNFGHYYRNLYRIIKFIDEKEFYSLESVMSYAPLSSKLNSENQINLCEILNNTKRYQYTSMVRAQLSDYELWWLTFNCLWIEGKKFEKLVNKYCLLKNHPHKELLAEKIALFEESAYDKRENKNILCKENNWLGYNEEFINEFLNYKI